MNHQINSYIAVLVITVVAGALTLFITPVAYESGLALGLSGQISTLAD
jgi:hypothetical protein